VHTLRFGHPLAVDDPADPLPDLDFGPVIHASKAAALNRLYAEGVAGGGIPLFRGDKADGRFSRARTRRRTSRRPAC
jgi:hypothetical protein